MVASFSGNVLKRFLHVYEVTSDDNLLALLTINFRVEPCFDEFFKNMAKVKESSKK